MPYPTANPKAHNNGRHYQDSHAPGKGGSLRGYAASAALEDDGGGEDDLTDVPSATGHYPDPVWAAAQSLSARPLDDDGDPGDGSDDLTDVPSATGHYPDPVWAPSSTASALAAGDSDLRAKDPAYSDTLTGQAEIPERPEPEGIVPLDNREIYRIIREVATADSGDDRYAAVMPQDGFGLCFGLVLFSQASGHLGAVLRLMQTRDAALFRDTFGPDSDALVAVTNARTQAERMQTVGGESLTSQSWMERFRKAGAIEAFQAAQNEQAIEGQFRPMLRAACQLGLLSDRALAMAYDRVVICGLGGGLRWVVEAVAPFRTCQQREHALEMLGFDDPGDFQAACGLPRDGRFGPLTLAALTDAARREGRIPMPSCDDLMARLVASTSGAARKRLERLRDSSQLQDIYYRFAQD